MTVVRNEIEMGERTWPNAQRRIVVAGEMLELGPLSPELHRETGRHCAENDVSWLLAVQGDASSSSKAPWQRAFRLVKRASSQTPGRRGNSAALCLNLET